MALIRCPECGKQVSDRAAACIYCGCPIGSAANGTLKIELKTHMKLIGNVAIDVSFNGETAHLLRGNQYRFVVPGDGKSRTCQIMCYHGFFDGQLFNFTINSGETKTITIIFDDTRFGVNKWQYVEERFV